MKSILYPNLTTQFLKLFFERRDDLKKVAHDPEVRHLEDRGVRIFVHGHDHLGGGHPGEVLDVARNAEGQVEVGGNGLPGLADLVLVADPAGVNGRAGGEIHDPPASLPGAPLPR